MKTILQERGLWKDGLKCRCNAKLAELNFRENANPSCCATHILSQQPDFLLKTSKLEEVLRRTSHYFAMYPKFHCVSEGLLFLPNIDFTIEGLLMVLASNLRGQEKGYEAC
ncbi:hypothetical protein V1520DRAFT_103416 [Lipomyces starkeyi]